MGAIVLLEMEDNFQIIRVLSVQNIDKARPAPLDLFSARAITQ